MEKRRKKEAGIQVRQNGSARERGKRERGKREKGSGGNDGIMIHSKGNKVTEYVYIIIDMISHNIIRCR